MLMMYMLLCSVFLGHALLLVPSLVMRTQCPTRIPYQALSSVTIVSF